MYNVIYQLCKFISNCMHGSQPIKCGFHFSHGSAVLKVKSKSDWSIWHLDRCSNGVVKHERKQRTNTVLAALFVNCRRKALLLQLRSCNKTAITTPFSYEIAKANSIMYLGYINKTFLKHTGNNGVCMVNYSKLLQDVKKGRVCASLRL